MTGEIDPPTRGTAPTQAHLLATLSDGRKTKSALADELGLAPTGMDSAREALRDRGYDIPYEREGQSFYWTLSEADCDRPGPTSTSCRTGWTLVNPSSASTSAISHDRAGRSTLTSRRR